MKTIRILILEDDLETVSILIKKLQILQDDVSTCSTSGVATILCFSETNLPVFDTITLNINVFNISR